MHAPDRASLLRLVRLVVVVAMGWSILVAAAMAFWGGEALWLRLAALGPTLPCAAFVLFAANHLLRFARWQLMLRAEGHRVPWRRSLAIFLAGLALLPTPAKAGVAARSVLLLDEGVPGHVSLAAYFVERLTDLVGLVMLATLLLGAGGAVDPWLLGLAVGVVGLVGIVVAPVVCRALRPRVERRPAFARAIDWLLRFFADAADMLKGWRLPAFLAIGILANCATGVLLWFALAGTAAPLDLASAFGVLGASHLSGSASMLPGGIGGFELAMMALLASHGIAAADALTAVALVRLATLWGSVAVGLPLLWLGLRRQGHAPGPVERERSPVA